MTTHTISYSSDGFNGLIDWLGKDKGTTTFANPDTVRGLVSTSQSTTHAGLSASNAVDQATDTGSGRSHTTNVNNSWWEIDFGADTGVQLTQFGIKGQAHATHQPRNFLVLGSVDGTGWEILHDEDSTGPGNDTWWSTAISSTNYFRYIRILQYGLNSSSAAYLVLGDIEIWGTWDDNRDFTHTPETGETTLTYSSDGFNGIIDFLGRDKGGVGFANPDTVRGYVTTSANSTLGSNDPDHAIGQRNEIYHSNGGGTAEWLKFDFGDGATVQPTRFGIRSRDDADAGHIYNFDVEGSDNDSTWTTLASVTTDGPTPEKTWYSVACTAAQGYRYIRLKQTGNNRSGGGHLTLGEVEMWGTYDDGIREYIFAAGTAGTAFSLYAQNPPSVTELSMGINAEAGVSGVLAGPQQDTTLVRLNEHVQFRVDVAFEQNSYRELYPKWTSIAKHVRQFSVGRGRSRPLTDASAGNGGIVVDNTTALYPAPSWSGIVQPTTLPEKRGLPMRQTRIQAVHDGTTYDVFRGFSRPTWSDRDKGTFSEVQLQLADAFSNLNLTRVASTYASQITDDRIDAILDAADWPTALRNLTLSTATVSQTTLPATTSWDGGALSLLQRTVRWVHRSFLYLDGAGRIATAYRQEPVSAPNKIRVSDSTSISTAVRPIDRRSWIDLESVRNDFNISFSSFRGTHSVTTSTHQFQDNSIEAYGKRTLDMTVDVTAGFLEAQFVALSNPEPAFNVTVNPEIDNRYAYVLAAEPNDTVLMFTTNVQPSLNANFFIDNLRHTVNVSDKSWITNLQGTGLAEL